MASTRKKVIVRTLRNELHFGYLPAAKIVRLAETRLIDLLDLEGRLAPMALAEVRWIAYVRDFNRDDAIEPERLYRKTFLARPRTEGLWLRLTLVGGEVLEGLAPIDITLLDAFAEDCGVYLIPPDVRSNTQRLFVPRSAIVAAQVVAVVTTPSRSKAAPGSVGEGERLPLFPES